MSGVLPSIIYPSTVADEQKRLLASLQGTDDGVQTCTSLDDATRASWGQFYITVKEFCAESPGVFGLGTMMDRAQGYEGELAAWQKLIASKGCALTVPTFDPNAPPPGGSDLVKSLQYVMWTAVALGGAYVVGQVASFIPKPPSRK